MNMDMDRPASLDDVQRAAIPSKQAAVLIVHICQCILHLSMDGIHLGSARVVGLFHCDIQGYTRIILCI